MGGFPGRRCCEHVLAARAAEGACSSTARRARSTASRSTFPASSTDLSFYPWPPENLRELALGPTSILVCGGNTANMLAVWRVHGFDAILREAWEAGVLLTGWSAGMICWFEAGVTDSFGPQLEGMRDGLGFCRERVPPLRQRGAAATGVHGLVGDGLPGRGRARRRRRPPTT